MCKPRTSTVGDVVNVVAEEIRGPIGSAAVLVFLKVWKTGSYLSTLNAADFGAVANDGNDDRAAIQATIDHANPGDKVVFNSGTFNLNGQVNLKGGITLTSVSGTEDALLDSYFAPSPGNGWVNGSNFAFRGDDVSGLSVDNLKFKANSGIFNFNTADNVTFRWNEFQWGYEGNYYNRHAFYIGHSANGLIIEKNNFHDSENSDRNLEVWDWANGSYSYNTFYKINDGGHIMNPGDNSHEGKCRPADPSHGYRDPAGSLQAGRIGRRTCVIEDNVFCDWNKPFWDSMGLSVPVAGENVTIRNNYLQQNAFNGEWGQADSSGKVRRQLRHRSAASAVRVQPAGSSKTTRSSANATSWRRRAGQGHDRPQQQVLRHDAVERRRRRAGIARPRHGERQGEPARARHQQGHRPGQEAEEEQRRREIAGAAE